MDLDLSSLDSTGILVSFIVTILCIIVVIKQHSLIGKIKKTGEIKIWEDFAYLCKLTMLCSLFGFIISYFLIVKAELNLEMLCASLPLTFCLTLAEFTSGKIEKELFEKRNNKN